VKILEGYRQRDAGEIAVLGLDPGRQRAKLKPRIGIVLQSTGVDQYLTVAVDEAQYLADRLAVIAAGRIVADGPPGSLAGRDTARARLRFRLPHGAEPPAPMTLEATGDGWVEATPVSLIEALHRLSGWAIEQGFDLNDLEILRPSLEDVYLQLTGGQVAPSAFRESRP
jgi:ABC-2 type transport system ATP-binding protein